MKTWTVYLCPDCGKPEITANATEVYGFDSAEVCPGFDAEREQTHAASEAVEYVPRSEVERLTAALALLRGHVADDEGWKLTNDALWLGARDETSGERRTYG